LPTVQPNPNTAPAGVLRDGVLSVTLDAQEAVWTPNGPSHRPASIQAFSELGKPPVAPGPLLRAPVGTTLRVSVRNSLRLPFTFFMPGTVHGAPDRMDTMDSIVVAPGSTQTLTSRATVAGNYGYHARFDALPVSGVLVGALIVDTAGASEPPHDRVFVLMETADSATAAARDRNPGAVDGHYDYTINGLSWPRTERIHATVGDSIHWRVLNGSGDLHPMHLHGTYFRVDKFTGPLIRNQVVPAPRQFVATQLMTGGSAMSMTWVPDRPGNWLFHCHFALHLEADSLSADPGDMDMRDMSGLVMGTIVAPRPGARMAREPAPQHRLRLVAVEDSTPGGEQRSTTPSMHFVVEDHGRRTQGTRDISPEIDLTRGEPVAITVVNHLREPTSVHWHAIEVEDSYMDGVPGFSGSGNHLSPAIAPGDSFVARFTPPRSGTFMYHAHADEMREQTAGLTGAVIVREPGETPSPDEHVLFLKSSRYAGQRFPLEVNGRLDPDTLVLRAGHPALLRVINLATQHHNTIAPTLVLVDSRDSGAAPRRPPLLWRLLAKDGYPLPDSARAPRPARVIVAMGETYDVEFTPDNNGSLRLEIATTAFQARIPRLGPVLMTVPIRVEADTGRRASAPPLVRANSDTAPAGVLHAFSPIVPGQMVVTQLLRPFTAMSIAWSPDRPAGRRDGRDVGRRIHPRAARSADARDKRIKRTARASGSSSDPGGVTRATGPR
jgi:FtsP/CotA-like multicopper oxidase with cupredoxin domain